MKKQVSCSLGIQLFVWLLFHSAAKCPLERSDSPPRYRWLDAGFGSGWIQAQTNLHNPFKGETGRLCQRLRSGESPLESGESVVGNSNPGWNFCVVDDGPAWYLQPEICIVTLPPTRISGHYFAGPQRFLVAERFILTRRFGCEGERATVEWLDPHDWIIGLLAEQNTESMLLIGAEPLR